MVFVSLLLVVALAPVVETKGIVVLLLRGKDDEEEEEEEGSNGGIIFFVLLVAFVPVDKFRVADTVVGITVDCTGFTFVDDNVGIIVVAVVGFFNATDIDGFTVPFNDDDDDDVYCRDEAIRPLVPDVPRTGRSSERDD